MAKCKIFPNYTDLFFRESDTAIVLKRRCYDGVTRYITTMQYNTKAECDEKWDNDCGA
jgi:hypothetical protein